MLPAARSTTRLGLLPTCPAICRLQPTWRPSTPWWASPSCLPASWRPTASASTLWRQVSARDSPAACCGNGACLAKPLTAGACNGLLGCLPLPCCHSPGLHPSLPACLPGCCRHHRHPHGGPLPHRQARCDTGRQAPLPALLTLSSADACPACGACCACAAEFSGLHVDVDLLCSLKQWLIVPSAITACPGCPTCRGGAPAGRDVCAQGRAPAALRHCKRHAVPGQRHGALRECGCELGRGCSWLLLAPGSGPPASIGLPCVAVLRPGAASRSPCCSDLNSTLDLQACCAALCCRATPLSSTWASLWGCQV